MMARENERPVYRGRGVRNRNGGAKGFSCVALCIFLLCTLPQARAELVITPQQAQSGSLLFEMRSGYRTATRINTEIRLDVSGMIVRATLRQEFRNDGSDWVEGVYVFPLPDTAAVDHMRFVVGERIVEGEIQEKEKARAGYEAAKQAGKRASLVDQQRANLFTTRIANIGPGETIEIVIQYLDTVKYEDGTFSLRFPTTLTPRYIAGRTAGDRQGTGWSADTDRVPDASLITPPQVTRSTEHRLSLHATIDAGVPLKFIASRYHPIDVQQAGGGYEARLSLDNTQLDHDLELLWRPFEENTPQALVFSEIVGDQTHLFVMLVPPIGAEAPPVVPPRNLIFVIDTSGSMHGVSIEQARNALLRALEGLRPVDRFNVVQFNSTTESLFSASATADAQHLALAREYVRSLSADGGTEMRPALERALAGDDASEHLRQVIFITDGSVGNEAELYGVIEEQLGVSRLFTVGIGSAPNSWFMRKAAELGRGTHVTISALHEVQEQMDTLFRKLERPQITDIEVDWPPAVTVTAHPAVVPDLYDGEPVLLRARLDGSLGADEVISIRGRSMVGDWVAELELPDGKQSPGVGSMWARAHIETLLDRERQGMNPEEVRAQVLALALQHHLVSKFTSLVAVDKTPVRPSESTLCREQVANLLPHGQSQQAIFGFPATATHAAAYRHLGTLCVLLATLLLLGRVWTMSWRDRGED